MRTPEEGHTFQCMAKTMIAAIENQRDYLADVIKSRFAPISQSSADFEFATWVQDNGARYDAERYYDERLTECTCPPFEYHS